MSFRNLFSPLDFEAMRRLAASEWQDTLHVIDLAYRFSSWAMDDLSNAGMWTDDTGAMQAWAAMQTPFWTVDIVLDGAAPEVVLDEVLDWIDRRAVEMSAAGNGLPAWFVNVFARQTSRIEHLQKAGFTCQSDLGEESWSKVWMRCDASTVLRDYLAPPGYRIRPLNGAAETTAYVDLHQAVFGTKNMRTGWRQRMLQTPGYTPDLDIVVQAPDGRLAAFCIGWILRGADGALHGQIEPLGCHADFRRFALGRVALVEVMRRLQKAGAVDIWVETDNYRDTAFRLYQSLGFHVAEEVLVFRKNYGE